MEVRTSLEQEVGDPMWNEWHCPEKRVGPSAYKVPGLRELGQKSMCNLVGNFRYVVIQKNGLNFGRKFYWKIW